jgi:hypothetical protein
MVAEADERQAKQGKSLQMNKYRKRNIFSPSLGLGSRSQRAYFVFLTLPSEINSNKM